MGQGCSSKRGPVVLSKGPNHTQSSKGRDDAARNAFHLVLDKTDPFNDLPEGLVDELYYKSELVEYKGRQSVYERRGIADAFYIVIKGSVLGDDGAAASGVGVLFGHTEIVQENPRTRTMTAGRGGATLRRVFADDYRAAVEKRQALLQTNAYRVLQETPVFSGMTSRELMHLKDLVYVKSFAPREVIIQRGSTSADEMYIIESGAAIVSDYADESNQQSLISKATGGLICVGT
ncbi:MAG: cyclic nucleotide-binding domain-containing protein [Chitinophagia bacterium]|nr:cyclic nucleotide-binding domain-containing protein [Chitinophagia bacterium]